MDMVVHITRVSIKEAEEGEPQVWASLSYIARGSKRKRQLYFVDAKAPLFPAISEVFRCFLLKLTVGWLASTSDKVSLWCKASC